MVRRKKEKVNKELEDLLGFNPSSRKMAELPKGELDYISDVIEKAAVKFAEEEDKRMMILIIAIIRQKLRTDPNFSKKLRVLLELDRYARKLTKKTVYINHT